MALKEIEPELREAPDDATPAATDSVTLHFHDLVEFKLLSAKQEKALGIAIFRTKLALRNLSRLGEANLLSPQQKIEAQNVLVSKKGWRLVSVLKNELEQKPKAIEKKKASNKDADSERKFLNDVAGNDQMLREKINSGNQIPSEFVTQQLKFIEEGFEAVDLLVTSNLGLANAWARKYQGKGLELDDLIVFAEEGLITAADKFDYRMGNKFSTFAVQWIMQKIKRGIQEESFYVRLPSHIYEILQRVRAIQRKRQQASGEEISLEDIIRQEIPKAEQESLLQALRTRQISSLDSPINGKDDILTIADAVPDSANTAEEATNNLLQKDIMEELLKILKERELEIILMRFGLDDGTAKTLDQIGAKFKITRERVRQLEERALNKLRNSPTFSGRFAELAT